MPENSRSSLDGVRLGHVVSRLLDSMVQDRALNYGIGEEEKAKME